MTWANWGLPPTSCRTLGSFDLRRVPLPAAMMAMAVREELLIGFAMTFNYKVFCNDKVTPTICPAHPVMGDYALPHSSYTRKAI